MPSGMTKSTAREKTVSMMPVKAPLNKYTVPASTYYPAFQQQQQTRVATYMPAYVMPTYQNMVAKRPVVIGYHMQARVSSIASMMLPVSRLLLLWLASMRAKRLVCHSINKE